MELKNDRIVVNDAPVDAVGGAKPEPEERPAERQADTESPVTWGQGAGAKPLPPGANPSLPATITAPGAVHEMFDLMSNCASCKHFNLRRGQKYVERLAAGRSFEDRQELNVVLLALCPSGPNVDPRDGLPFVGTCDVYTRLFRDNGYNERDAEFLTTNECRCPTMINHGKLAGQPLPHLHKNLNKTVERMISAFRDRLRWMAMGRRG